MFKKGKRELRNKEEDIVFNRMLLWLVGAVVLELLIVLMRKLYVEMIFGAGFASALFSFFQVFSIVGAVLMVSMAVWSVLNLRNGKSAVLSMSLAGAAALLWVISLVLYLLFDEGIRILMMLTAAGAVLILIFFLYQRAFFYSALLTAGGLLALWLHGKYYIDHPNLIRVCIIAGVVVLAAAAALAFQLRKNDGELAGIRILPVESNYTMTWITCGVTAVVMVLALILGVGLSQYLLYVLAGWLFVQAVFFTVKMM